MSGPEGGRPPCSEEEYFRPRSSLKRTPPGMLMVSQSDIGRTTPSGIQSSPSRAALEASKEIIAKVYRRMKYEAEKGVENLSDARWQTAQAVGYSEHTISNTGWANNFCK
ncbi:hypothetical protein ACJJTC_010547 [Scirpophaga incertulas]